jgi:serine/threonine protein kinase
MNKIKHKNVLRLFDVLEEPNGIYIITEYCDGGDLKKLMNKTKAKQVAEGKSDPNRGSLSEGLIFDIFCQIVSGMTEVNKQLCFHRDLKPENIMINQDGTVKIADFGLAREIIGNDVFKLEKFSAKGTPIYAAPNVIRGQKFSVLCDVWSLGLLVYELLVGKNYFEAATNMYTLQGLQEQLVNKPMKIPQHFNKFFLDILPKMVTFSEDNRINFFKLNEMLEKEKFDIIKSIDPHYKLNSGPSPSMGPSMGPTIPSFQVNTYATDVKGMGHNVPTVKTMNQKQQE